MPTSPIDALKAEGYADDDARQIAADVLAEHAKRQARQSIADTAHVHDVAHAPVITTEPVAHLKEDAKRGADLIVLQPRHVANAFGTLIVGEGKAEETVTVLSVQPRWSEPFPEGPPIREVVASLVTIEGTTTHAHSAGAPVSAPGFDPESVDASGVICHDCNQHLVRDTGSDGPLVCPKVHGIRPMGMEPELDDGAVECGQPPEG